LAEQAPELAKAPPSAGAAPAGWRTRSAALQAQSRVLGA
jgi:hypothetical protein